VSRRGLTCACPLCGCDVAEQRTTPAPSRMARSSTARATAERRSRCVQSARRGPRGERPSVCVARRSRAAAAVAARSRHSCTIFRARAAAASASRGLPSCMRRGFCGGPLPPRPSSLRRPPQNRPCDARAARLLSRKVNVCEGRRRARALRPLLHDWRRVMTSLSDCGFCSRRVRSVGHGCGAVLLPTVQFTIGRGQVIKGWDQGFATMCRGEKAVLICRSE
jgi:hypothetical protein